MAAEYGFVKPSYVVCANPQKIALVREFEAETATIYPGMLCKRGTTDAEAVANDTSDNVATILGFAGYEQASLDDRPDTIDTVYAAQASVPVLNGPGMVVRARVQASIAVTVGEFLQAGYRAGGLAAGAATEQNIAIALEAKSISAATGSVACWVISLI